MKEKIKYFIPVFFIALVLMLAPRSFAAPSNNPVFVTIQMVQQMISNAISPVQNMLNDHEGRIQNLEGKVIELEGRIEVLEGAPSGCVEPPSGMLSWWPGDGNANDIVDANSGALTNGTTFASGKVGQAFSLDGVDDLVQSATSGLPTGNNDRTIDLWVKINSFLADVPDSNSPLETFFAGYGNFGSSGQAYALGTAGNVLYFSQWGSAIFGPSLETDRWYHVVVTNQGDFARLYLNGVEVASGNVSINTPAGTNFYIGRVAGPLGDIRRLNGLVDEVEVFDRALSQAEIQAIFEADSEGKCKTSSGLTDNFDGPNLNTDNWEFFSTNGGNYAFENGSILLPGGTSMFYIRTKNNPFPSSGPFEVEFGIQYTIVDESGVGVALGFEQQNGYDQSNIPVSYWQDHNGLVVSRFGLTVATVAGVDTHYHVGKIMYDGDKYHVYLDGVLKYTSPSSATAKSLWFGNPFCCRNNWTGFRLDYIKVTQP